MAKTTVPGLYIADGAITAAKLSSTLDLSGVTLTVATASSGDNDTTVASTAFVQQEISALVDSSPSALNTLNELAAAIGDDANFSTTVTNSIATKLALAGGTMTGDLIINTTGALQIPVGTTAQRPTAAQGQLRFNTTTSKPEIYNGSAWADVGGGVESVNSATGVVTLDTDDISEGSTNLYFTNARADARIAAATTDDLSEGSTNLYFTTARANSAIDGRLSGSTGVTVSNGAISIGQDVATSTSPTFQNLTLSGTDSIKVPAGTTAQRSGSPANGMLRYNSTNGEFEGYQSGAWGALGGDTTSSVDLYTATGNGSTATYDTGKNPQSENNTWVFIGGVYQPKSTYSFSGTEITLSENLPNGEDLEVITGTVSTYNPTDAILGQYNATTSNTASYDTSLTTENENNVFVFIDGVYQPKSSYTYSGSTLTLDAVPTSGMSLEVLVTRSMNAATVTTGFLADDAVTTAKILNANVTADKLASSLDLTGKTVTVATASAGDNDTSVASTAFVRQEITALVDSAPAAMDTLNELAAALGDDANFSTTVNASIAAKLPLAGGTLTGDLNFGDNDKAIFGAGSDLQIYHDSSNSFIRESGTGDLRLLGSTKIDLRSVDDNTVMIRANAGGSVDLRYAGANKLTTTSTGIKVTGDIGVNNSSPLYGIHAIGDNEKIVVAPTNATSQAFVEVQAHDYNSGPSYEGTAIVHHSSSASGTLAGVSKASLGVLRFQNADNALIYTNGNSPIIFGTLNTERARFDNAGNFGIGTSSPARPLHISGTDSIQLELEQTSASSDVRMLLDAGGTSGQIQFAGASHASVPNTLSLTSAGDTRFVQAGQTVMHIDSASGGRVGIGTTGPGAPLDLETAGNTADGTYYSTFTINNTGSSTWSRIRFDRGGVARWGLSLGTDDKFKISNLFTNGTSANPDDNVLVIDNASKIGIGTDSPGYKLDVTGTGRFLSDSTDSRVLYLKQHASNNGNIVQFVDQADTNVWELVGRGNQFYIYNNNLSTFSLYINPTTNGIGIGHNATNERLDVNGSVKIGNVKIQDADSGRIGLNRNTANGVIYNSAYSAFQINGAYTNANFLDFQEYTSAGTYNGGMKLQDGKLAVGSGNGSFSGTPENAISIAHDGHGLGLDYVGATLPRTAGMFTSSTAHTQTGYGDLNIKARTDYGGYYGIGFFTASSNSTPVRRMKIDTNGNVTKPNQCYFFCRPPGSHSITANSDHTVTGTWVQDHDVGNNFGTNSFTAPVDGIYAFNFQIFLNGASTRLDAFIAVNGSQAVRTEQQKLSNANVNHTQMVHATLKLQANDSVTFGVYANASTTVYSVNSPWSYASGYLLG